MFLDIESYHTIGTRVRIAYPYDILFQFPEALKVEMKFCGRGTLFYVVAEFIEGECIV